MGFLQAVWSSPGPPHDVRVLYLAQIFRIFINSYKTAGGSP